LCIPLLSSHLRHNISASLYVALLFEISVQLVLRCKDTDYLVFSPNTSSLNTPWYPAHELRFLEAMRVDLSQVILIPVLKLSLSVSLFFTITDYPSFMKKQFPFGRFRCWSRIEKEACILRHRCCIRVTKHRNDGHVSVLIWRFLLSRLIQWMHNLS